MVCPEKLLAIKCIVSITDYQVNVTVQVSKLLADLVVGKCTTTQLMALISEKEFHLHPDLSISRCYCLINLQHSWSRRLVNESQ